MNSMSRIFIILLLLTGNFFMILVPFEILAHYPNINISQWLKEVVQWFIDKVFEDKIGLIGCKTFVSYFCFFRFLTEFVVVFIIVALIVTFH